MQITVRDARLSFFDVFKATTLADSKPFFSATLICSDDTKLIVDGEVYDHEHMLELVEDAKLAKFKKINPKATFKDWVYNKADGSTTRDAYVDDEGDYYGGIDEDTWLITGRTMEEKAPGGKIVVLDQSKSPIQASSGKLYSGCYVDAVIDLYAFDGKHGKGTTASLIGLQLRRSGEALGFKQIDASEAFGTIEPEDGDMDDLC